MKGPCKNCERREQGCHSRCPDYAKYRKGIDDASLKRREVEQYAAWQSDKIRRISKL